jgi:hypothetical protein
VILTSGKRYRAYIRLGFFEQAASNETVRGKLEDAGFCFVAVGGRGRDRVAEGTWGQSTQDVELPEQVIADTVQEVA